MAAYTTLTKVKAMFRKLDTTSANAAVTDAEIEVFISEADAEINGALYPYYETPITGVESLKIMSKISTFKVAHIVKTILEQNNQIADVEQDVQTNLEKKAELMLKKLVPVYNTSGNYYKPALMVLSDAVQKDFGPGKAAKFKVGNSADPTFPTFKKGTPSW